MGLLYGVVLYSLLTLILIFILIYFYITSSYNHWQNRGVPYIKPSFPFGNLEDVVMGRKSHLDLIDEQYRQFENKKFFGIFNFSTPVLVLRDPSLIEKVLITDFTYFCDKVKGATKNNDILAFYLSNLEGDVWRQLRQKLNGAFSVMKLKRMAEEMSKCADLFVETVGEYESKKEAAKADSLGEIFSQRVIANAAFGIEWNCGGIQDFVQNLKRTFFGIKVVHLIFLSYQYIPQYAKLLYFIPPVAKFVTYFQNLTEAAIHVRQHSLTKRNDYLQILLDLKEEESFENDINTTKLKNEGIASEFPEKFWDKKCLRYKVKQILSNHCITSQMFIFMSLGLESTSLSLAFLLYDLASNPHVQLKVQQEVDAVVNKYSELSYEPLQQLNYLDMVIQESMRMSTRFPCITRICQATYKIPGSELVIEKGTTVMIPLCSVHMDSQNYPDPKLFNPDRFTDNHFKPSATFLPLGAGPRMCIAIKLVVLQLKIAVAKVMLKYSVRLSTKTQLPIRYAPRFLGELLNGIWIEFESRSLPTLN